MLCVTENGRLGLTPYGTKAGDSVAVVMGCGIPLILRSTEIDGGYTGLFWLVGEAYVYGIMEGEAVQDADFAPDELRVR